VERINKMEAKIIAGLICGVGFVLWFFFMRSLGAFKTREEVWANTFYICANCGNRICWNKSTQILDRTCPHCGVVDFTKSKKGEK